MTVAGASDRRWVVIQVWRGLPAGVEVYQQEQAARERERALRESIKPEDEVGVFELDLANDPAVGSQ
jgi:hypothetical protein